MKKESYDYILFEIKKFVKRTETYGEVDPDCPFESKKDAQEWGKMAGWKGKPVKIDTLL